jgi:thiamine biosynthesis lipoprotein
MRRVLVPHAVPPAPQAAGGGVSSFRGVTMGTTWSVNLVAPKSLPLLDALNGVQKELDRVVAQMSTWDADSDISRFNRAPAGTWHVLPAEFFAVVAYALSVAEASGGAYDPTVGPLVNLWGFGPEPKRSMVPAAAELDAARARCGWRQVLLEFDERRVFQPGGLYVDLSAVAKGFGVDQAARYLLKIGVTDFLIEVGGELRGEGTKPDGTPWWVALEHPPVGGLTPTETVAALHGLSIATSGDYRKFAVIDGRHLSHTIDPRTGHPVAGKPASVTVLHADCMRADALATAITVLGADEGMRFAERQGIAALSLTRAGQGFEERMTSAFVAMLA